MIFQSKYAGYVVHIRDPQYYTDPHSGFREQIRPSLTVDFLDGSVVSSHRTDDGVMTHDIRGGTIDTDEYANRLGWTPEEKTYAEAALLSRAKDPRFTDMWLWEPPIPDRPWPNYDDMHHFKIAGYASDGGYDLAGVLHYEQTHKNRESVTKALEEKIGEQVGQEQAQEALTAV